MGHPDRRLHRPGAPRQYPAPAGRDRAAPGREREASLTAVGLTAGRNQRPPRARGRRDLLRRLGGLLVAVPRLAGSRLAARTLAASPLFGPAPAAADDDLGYRRETTWRVDGAPEVNEMLPTIRAVLERVRVSYPGVDRQAVEGFYPGPNYSYAHLPGWTPFYLYARDTATILPLARWLYPASTLTSAVEEFLRLQYPDGAVSATIAPDFTVDKATAVSDEESSLVLAAAEAFAAGVEPGWLLRDVRGRPLVERLEQALEWLLRERRDPATGLVARAHTTDWGDVKWEPSATPTDLRPGDQLTASIYDQAIAYAALRGLARLQAAVGRAEQATRWQAEADALRARADALLWQDAPERGYYRIHLHLGADNLPHPFDEGAVVAIGNAAAVYYGLAPAERVERIWAALERARLAAGAPKVGLTLDPPYADWQESQMGPRVYQNGAIWDWWGGRQVTAEFRSGYTDLAWRHLRQIAADWATHPGRVREWESPWLGRTGRDEGYAGAAAVMGEALLSGLFGVQADRRTVRLTPRLKRVAGAARAYEPASDTYVAYRYNPGPGAGLLSLAYGSNSPYALAIHLPLPWSGGRAAAWLDDGDPLPVAFERVGEETLLLLTVPSGTHRVLVERTGPSEGRRAGD